MTSPAFTLLRLTVLLLLAYPLASQAVIFADNSAASPGQISGSGTGTISGFAVGDNPYRHLVVAVAGEQGGPPTSVTYGGAALTLLSSGTVSVSHASVWGLENPIVGSADIVVTTGLAGNGLRFGAVSVASDQRFSIHDTDSKTTPSGPSLSLDYEPFSAAGFYVDAAEQNGGGNEFVPVAGGSEIFHQVNGSGGYEAFGAYGGVSTPLVSNLYDGDGNNRRAVAGVAFIVPEPSRALLLLLGCLPLALSRRR